MNDTTQHAAELKEKSKDLVEYLDQQARSEFEFVRKRFQDYALHVIELWKLIESRRADAAMETFDMRAHLQRQREWSERTFGPGPRAAGVVDHIRKELSEIEADPADLAEWVDVVILALDGAWRAGFSPDEIIAQITAKQTKNENRVWPDWRTMPLDKAIEHDRSKDAGMEKDAERYRWLRQRMYVKEIHSDTFFRNIFPMDMRDVSDDEKFATDCDAAIDAALRATDSGDGHRG